MENVMKANIQTRIRLSLYVALTTLMFSGIASGALVKLEEVVEAELSSVSLPGHQADQILIKSCDACEQIELRVGSNTVYRVGGRAGEAVSLQEFSRVVRNDDQGPELFLLIAYAPETKIVTRLVAFTEAVESASARK